MSLITALLLTAHADGPEVCNGIDDDGDGSTDEGPVAATVDNDGDGSGSERDLALFLDCGSVPVGRIPDWGDCDDRSGQIEPGRPEQCNAADDDCDGTIDEGTCPGTVNVQGAAAYLTDLSYEQWDDADALCSNLGWALATPTTAEAEADLFRVLGPYHQTFWLGYSDAAVEGRWVWVDGTVGGFSRWDVGQPDDYNRNEDCAVVQWDQLWNDLPCWVYAAVVCERACEVQGWYLDGDGDGLGDPASRLDQCGRPAGRVANALDCDDSDPAEPGLWYRDADHDGYGSERIVSCETADTVSVDGDCRDDQASIHPGAEDIPADLIDQDCDGSDAVGELPPDHTGELPPDHTGDAPPDHTGELPPDHTGELPPDDTAPPEEDTEAPPPTVDAGGGVVEPPEPAYGFGCDGSGPGRGASAAVLLAMAVLGIGSRRRSR